MLGLLAVVLAGVGLIGGLLVNAAVGARPVALATAWRLVWHDDGSVARAIVWDLRLPRALLAALVGANLSMAGVVMQAITHNPLASPGLTGATAGGALAVVAATILVPALPAALLPAVGFVGAAMAGAASMSLAWKGGNVTPVRLALAGAAVAMLSGALTTTLLLSAGAQTASIYFWLLGGFSGRGWRHVELIWGCTVAGLLAALLTARQLNLLWLGTDVAQALGLRVARWRLAFALLALALTGVAVAVAGPIGFVGLIVPHTARLLLGTDQRRLLPAAALFGATLLMLADLGARTLFAPEELPVGLLTVALGAPVFIALVRRHRFADTTL